LKPLRWLDPAVVEAEEAAAYYGERTERGAKQFGEQLWAAITLVREYPEAGARTGFPIDACRSVGIRTAWCIAQRRMEF